MHANEIIIEAPCPICTDEDEVGCVTRDAAGLVACEGCRRERRTAFAAIEAECIKVSDDDLAQALSKLPDDILADLPNKAESVEERMLMTRLVSLAREARRAE